MANNTSDKIKKKRNYSFKTNPQWKNYLLALPYTCT